MTNQAIKDFADPTPDTDNVLSENVLPIKSQPLDGEIAKVFCEMRESSGQSLEALSAQLGTNVDLLKSLEKGDLSRLPVWEVCSPIISNYTKMLGIDPKPILRRVALNIQARQKVQSQKIQPSPEGGQPTPSNTEALKAGSLAEDKRFVKSLEKSVEQKGVEKVQPIDETKQNAILAASIIPAAQPHEIKFRPVDRETGSKPLPNRSSKEVLLEQGSQNRGSENAQKEEVLSELKLETDGFTKPQILTPLKAEPEVHDQSRKALKALKIPKELTISQDERHDTGRKSSLQGYDQPLFDATLTDPPLLRPQQTSSQGKESDQTLRADKRSFSTSGEEMLRPQINDLMTEEPHRLSALSWGVILLSLGAISYIAWFLYSEPQLGKILLEQLPFISKSTVLLDNTIINS